MVSTDSVVDNEFRVIENLPPFSQVALRIMRLLALEEVSVQEVTETIKSDTAFATELLRVANSALYGFSFRIRTVHHAAVALGLDFVKSLSMTVAMRTYVQHALKLPVLARCWRHSLACAVLSERLATASGLKGDIAHTAGILHDIGRLAFLVACPSDYARLLDNPKLSVNDLLAAERRMFDLDHCDAGLWLTVKWLLPNELVQPIGHHHDVEPPGEWGFTSIARLACGMAEALGFPSARLPNRVSLEDLRQELPPATRLRFDPDPAELKAELAKRIASLA